MDRDFLIDLFADFGPVTIRRMFSGYGISADGTNFALALRAGLYFRADETTIPLFQELLAQPDILSGTYDIHWLERWMRDQAPNA